MLSQRRSDICHYGHGPTAPTPIRPMGGNLCDAFRQTKCPKHTATVAAGLGLMARSRVASAGLMNPHSRLRAADWLQDVDARLRFFIRMARGQDHAFTDTKLHFARR